MKSYTTLQNLLLGMMIFSVVLGLTRAQGPDVLEGLREPVEVQAHEPFPEITPATDEAQTPINARGQGKPNVLFILTDDQPEHTLGKMSEVRRWLVRSGTTFENAYVSQSICCPSRASFLTGKYPHNHGVNSIVYPTGGERRFRETGGDRNTIATVLDSGGYRTALVGKYMNGYEGRYIPPGWNRWVGRVDPGVRKNAVRTNSRVVEIPANVHPTDYYRRHAVNFLDHATDSKDDPPFALFFHTNAPHLPAAPAPRHRNLYAGERPPRSASFDEADVSDKPRWVRKLPKLGKKRRAQINEDYRNTLRSLKGVDEAIGEMLRLLKRRGELRNTYVVFTSDHGQHFGEHRWVKERGAKSTPYEEAASIPLIIRGPGVRANVTWNELVLNNDLPVTLADLAGLTEPRRADGASLVPLLSGGEPPWRTAVMNERRATHKVVADIPKYRALITGRHTYVEYDSGERELYDRRLDPFQLESIQDTTDRSLVKSLSDRLRILKKCAGESCRVAEGFPPP